MTRLRADRHRWNARFAFLARDYRVDIRQSSDAARRLRAYGHGECAAYFERRIARKTARLSELPALADRVASRVTFGG